MVKVARGKALVARLRAQAGVRDPEALAAYLGRFKKARKAGKSVAQAKAIAKGASPTSASSKKPTSGPAPVAATGKPYSQEKIGGRFENLDDANTWAEKAYQPWVDSLTDEEKDALSVYKSSKFGPINRGLRSGNGDLDALGEKGEPHRSTIEAIDRALEKAPPLPEDIVVERGRFPNEVLDAFEEGVEDGLVGKVIGNRSYTSTTFDPAMAYQYGHGKKEYPRSIGRIVVPKGSKAGYLEGMKGRGESEMLLPRNAKLRIDKVETRRMFPNKPTPVIRYIEATLVGE